MVVGIATGFVATGTPQATGGQVLIAQNGTTATWTTPNPVITANGTLEWISNPTGVLPHLWQATAAKNVAPVDFVISPQQVAAATSGAGGSPTGPNSAPGNFIVALGAATAPSGTHQEAQLIVSRGGQNYVGMGCATALSNGNRKAGVWLGGNSVGNGSIQSAALNGDGFYTTLNAPPGAVLNLSVNDIPLMTMNATGITSAKFVNQSPTNTQSVYVNKGGNDTTGDGSFLNPYLTISKAMTSITDAVSVPNIGNPTASKVYAIYVGPGVYTDNVALKSGVAIVGTPWGGTQYDGYFSIDSGFMSDPGNDNGSVCTISNMIIVQNQNINWGSIQAALEFYNCIFQGVYGTSCFTMTGGYSPNETVACGFWECTIVNDVVFNDVYVTGQYNFFIGNSTLNATLGASNWDSTNDAFNGSLTLHAIDGYDLTFVGWNTSVDGTVTLDGANVAYEVDALAVSQSVVLLNGAAGPNLSGGSSTDGFLYTPANLTNWSGTTPTSLTNALDRIAAKIGPIP